MAPTEISSQSSETQRSGLVRRLFAIHGWSGIALGLLLYAVIVTGTVAVFAEQIGQWSSPLPTRPAQVLQPGLDAAVRDVAETVDPQYYEEVGIFAGTGDRLSVFFHTHVPRKDGGIVDKGVEFEYDPSNWALLDRSEGEGPEIRDADSEGALARFLVDLHVRLYLPDPWGLLLTGVLGLAMMVAAVTGLIVHRKLLSQLFVQRISMRNVLLTARDRHVVAGSWNLVFAFLLAFTGSFFSFAGSFGLNVMAMVATGGDQEKLIETVIGMPAPHDDSAAVMANLDGILADARQRSTAVGEEPMSLNVLRWGRADAIASVGMSPPDGSLSGRILMYDAATGEFMRLKPVIGLQPSLGNDVLGLIEPLHFGDFAGIFSKAAWFGMGCAAAYVVATGLLLWLQRRRAENWLRLEKLTLWMLYGLPMALVGSAIGFFAAPGLALDVGVAVKLGFLAVVAGVSLLVWYARDPILLRSRLLLAVAVSLLLVAPIRLLGGGVSGSEAIAGGWVVVPTLDLLLFASGLLCFHRWAAKHRGRPAWSAVARQRGGS